MAWHPLLKSLILSLQASFLYWLIELVSFYVSGFINWMHVTDVGNPFINILKVCLCQFQVITSYICCSSNLHTYNRMPGDLGLQYHTLWCSLPTLYTGRELEKRVKHRPNEDKWGVMEDPVHGKVWVQSRLCPALIYFSRETHSMVLK